MVTGFKKGATDLDDIFDPYVEGAKPAATAFKTADGIDLNQRYAPLSYGTQAAATGMKIAGGAVLNTLWAAKGSAVYAGPIDPGFGGPYSANQVGSGTVQKEAILTIKSDGTWAVTKSAGGTLGGTPLTGAWHSNPAAGVGAGCEVQVDGGAWQSLSVDLALSSGIANSDLNNTVQKTFVINFRNANGTSPSTGTVTLSASAFAN